MGGHLDQSGNRRSRTAPVSVWLGAAMIGMLAGTADGGSGALAATHAASDESNTAKGPTPMATATASDIGRVASKNSAEERPAREKGRQEPRSEKTTMGSSIPAGAKLAVADLRSTPEEILCGASDSATLRHECAEQASFVVDEPATAREESPEETRNGLMGGMGSLLAQIPISVVLLALVGLVAIARRRTYT